MQNKISPEFISGFTDAEGSFGISLVPKKNGRGWNVSLSFTIGLHISDLALLQEIKVYFQDVGTLRCYANLAVFSVRALPDLLRVIIPHFEAFPLHTQKQTDFLLFKWASLILSAGSHLLDSGMQQIVNIRASINMGLTSSLASAFPATVPVARPDVGLGNYTNE